MGRARRGYVLIAVLGALAIAGAISASYALAARRGVQSARADIDRARAQALARGGAVQAAKNLGVSLGSATMAGAGGRALGARAASTTIPGLPAFPPEMANAGGFLGAIAKKMQQIEQQKAAQQGRTLDQRSGGGDVDPLKPGAREGLPPEAPPPPLLALAPATIEIDGTKLDIELESESGKLDVNTTPREILRDLLVALGEPQSRAETILNAVEGRRIARQPENARDDGVALVAFRERPLRGARMRRLEELLSVDAVTPELYERLVPHLTVNGRSAVDPNYATRQVWIALGVRDERALERIGEARRKMERLTRETTAGLLGASTFGAVEDHLAYTLPPIFTVRCVARSGNAVGRHMIRIELGADRVPRALESREGWL